MVIACAPAGMNGGSMSCRTVIADCHAFEDPAVIDSRSGIELTPQTGLSASYRNSLLTLRPSVRSKQSEAEVGGLIEDRFAAALPLHQLTAMQEGQVL